MRSPSLDPPSALFDAEANAADAETQQRHERIWQEFLKRPAVFVYEPRFLRIPGVVAMTTVHARITDRSIRRRLRRALDALKGISCVEPFPDGYLHMTIVPPALLTTDEAKPPFLLPEAFESQALGPMKGALRGYGPFEVRIRGLNVFREVLVAVAYDGGHSAEVRRRLADAVPGLPQRYWGALAPVPHVSVGQFCNTDGVTELRDAVAQLRDVDFGTLHVTRVYLVTSPLDEGVFGEPRRRVIPLTG